VNYYINYRLALAHQEELLRQARCIGPKAEAGSPAHPSRRSPQPIRPLGRLAHRASTSIRRYWRPSTTDLAASIESA
jgi:hypothetical protein